MNSPVRFRMFLFAKLPSAFFSGVRIKEVNEDQCVVTVPYKWFSQNPFHSTYFACLAMAAEMSTGILGQMHIYKRTPAVSMLVVTLEAEFYKKATGITRFTCADGPAIKETIDQACATGKGQTIKTKSTGVNAADEIVATFLITWSFKEKR
jgi:hypothetical protein